LATAYDLAGAARIQQDTIDLGCYESPYNSVTLPTYNGIVFVVEGGAGTMTGESWTNAMGSIQDAVQIAAMNNANVWVAAGNYHGDGTSENAFVMKAGVNVYGGFVGNEVPDYDLSQRDFTTNATVLDGQFSQRVLMQPNHFTANTSAVWDGFTIQNGRVDGYGAGVYMQAYSTLRNCIVQYNYIASSSSGRGAGVYAYGSSSSQVALLAIVRFPIMALRIIQAIMVVVYILVVPMWTILKSVIMPLIMVVVHTQVKIQNTPTA
jgi:hypothetical protein